jgi:hypothetical protein
MARVDDALHGSGPAGGRIRPILQRGEGGGAGRRAVQKRPRKVFSPLFAPVKPIAEVTDIPMSLGVLIELTEDLRIYES